MLDGRLFTKMLAAALGSLLAVALPATAGAQRRWLPRDTTPASHDDGRIDALVYELGSTSRYSDALSAAEWLIELRTAQLGPEHPLTQLARIGAAEHAARAAEYGKAESLYRRVLLFLEKTGAPRSWMEPEVAGLAATYRGMGEFQRAEELYRSLLTDQGPRGSPGEALAELAATYKAKGDLDGAQALYERLLAAAEEAYPVAKSLPGSRVVGVALDDLADVLRLKGAHEQAGSLFQRAVGLLEVESGTSDLALATCLDHQALLRQQVGDPAGAEPIFRRALALRERALPALDPGVAEVLYNLGASLVDRGEHARAEPLLRHALSILRTSLGPEHPWVVECQSALEGIALAQGDVSAALEMRIAAVSAEDRVTTRLFMIGSDNEKRAHLAALERSTSATVSLHQRFAPQDRRATALALITLLRRKGRAIDAMADGLAILQRELGPEDQALLEQLAGVNARYSDRAPPIAGAPPLNLERRTIEAEVSRRSAAFRADRRPRLLSEVRAAIPKDAALIEIALYRPYQPAAKRADRLGAPRYAAYVLRRRGDTAAVDLGEAAEIDATVVELRRALSSPSRDAKRLARSLDSRIMAPIRPLLGDARRVLVSADGALHLVPFGALVDEKDRYLIEFYGFTYLTSGRELLRLARPRNPRQGAVIVGDPDFGAVSDRARADFAPCEGCSVERALDLLKRRFARLPATGDEASAVGRLLPGARVITREAATEAALKSVAGPSVLHLATHGFSLPGRAVEPDRDAHPGLDAADRARARATRRDNPLLRSGLALAGANWASGGSDDGVLSAAELSALDLHGTKLVVLSAHETGAGEASQGEGVLALRRSLAMAGAEAQVISLWRLDELATRDLMVAYYEKLAAGDGRSEGMREAQLELLAQQETAHPFFWAGFTVSGDGRALSLLDGAPRVEKVAPGVRGCACRVGAPEEGGSGALLAVAVAGALLGGRRRGTTMGRAKAP